ncbi:hypothetical protein KSP40_PGU019281 [Platanthera guangdongensis]|uniref:Uncharacterized protein n=1 Tax=Platanthera guangdongensis TaxID=2320717 RepID=A0ABR2MC86_9ASPA
MSNQMPSGIIKVDDRHLSITSSNETIHGIVRHVKRRSSLFLTETQVKLHLGTVVGLGVRPNWSCWSLKRCYVAPLSKTLLQVTVQIHSMLLTQLKLKRINGHY